MAMGGTPLHKDSPDPFGNASAALTASMLSQTATCSFHMTAVRGSALALLEGLNTQAMLSSSSSMLMQLRQHAGEGAPVLWGRVVKQQLRLRVTCANEMGFCREAGLDPI